MFTASISRFAFGLRQVRHRLSRAVLLAMLVGSGMVQAADPQEAARQRPLDLSLPGAAVSKPCDAATPGERCVDRKAYGTGYEARRFGTSRDNAASAAGQASSASIGTSASDLRGAAARPAGSGNRGGAGRHGRR